MGKNEVTIIDYGMGNLLNVKNALRKVGCEVKITNSFLEVENSRGLVLPGVGSFRDCVNNLKKDRLIDPIYKFIQSGRPFLGICLGMQILFTESEEFGNTRGLDIFKGKVVYFSKESGLKIPHMGWNSVKIRKAAPHLKDIPDNSYFYFVHSCYVIPDDKDIIATTTEYGEEFTSSIWKENVFACQFHPEKSQRLGLNILKNFKEVVENC